MAAAKQPTRFERISSWLMLAANLGVLGGIVLVILQLSQNEKMMRAQTRHEMAMGIVGLMSETSGNPQLADVMRRSESGDPLTPAESYQAMLRYNALLRYWEDVHYQYRVGLYDEEEFARERDQWKVLLDRSQFLVAQWCRQRAVFSAEFAAEVNGLIGPRACAATGQ